MARIKNHKTFVLNYLRKHKGLTNMEAMRLGVGRLSDVIFKLREQGYRIHTEMKRVDYSDGSYTMYGIYHLIAEPKEVKDGKA